jgi:hypothetical protein
VSVATATPPIVVVFVAPAIEAPSSEESGSQNIISCDITAVKGVFGWISLIVSPFQNRNGWIRDQDLDQLTNLVKASLGLSFPPIWMR